MNKSPNTFKEVKFYAVLMSFRNPLPFKNKKISLTPTCLLLGNRPQPLHPQHTFPTLCRPGRSSSYTWEAVEAMAKMCRQTPSPDDSLSSCQGLGKTRCLAACVCPGPTQVPLPRAETPSSGYIYNIPRATSVRNCQIPTLPLPAWPRRWQRQFPQGVVAHAYKPSTRETEAGKSLGAPGQPGLYRKTWFPTQSPPPQAKNSISSSVNIYRAHTLAAKQAKDEETPHKAHGKHNIRRCLLVFGLCYKRKNVTVSKVFRSMYLPNVEKVS